MKNVDNENSCRKNCNFPVNLNNILTSCGAKGFVYILYIARIVERISSVKPNDE